MAYGEETVGHILRHVGVKGMINVLDACRGANVRTLVLASSSEVYQTPPRVPTDENVPLVVPDVLNARYSYGGGKIISELLAVNYGRMTPVVTITSRSTFVKPVRLSDTL